MLPPLGAALSASVDYQSVPRQPLQATLVSAAANSRASVPLPANLLSGGRIDLLSLSGQMHLAQGLSVFAEAVGSYLKISRREGESLVDYAHRLAEALKSLSAAQRAVLEQSIAQMVRGITLRMLAEILNDPLGPEAARLNAYMESGRFLDRDPAARAVVSSYRQNAAADLSVNAIAPGRLPASVPTPGEIDAQAQTNANGRQTLVSGTGAAVQTGGTGSPLNSGQVKQAGMAHVGAKMGDEPLRQQQAPDGAKTSFLRPEVPSNGRTRAEQVGGLSAPGASASHTGNAPDLPSLRAVDTQRAATAREILAGRSHGAEAAARAPEGPRGSLMTYDAPALARVAERLKEDVKNLPAQAVRYLAERLAKGSEPAVMPGASSPLGVRSSSSAASISQQGKAFLAVDTIPGVETLSSHNQDPRIIQSDLLSRPPVEIPAPGPASLNDGSSRATGASALIEQALFLPMVSMVAREGLMQPFVTYPSVPVPPEEEERDVERLSPVDEDGEGHPSGQDARDGSEEDAGEDGEANEQPPEATAGEDPADHAQDLYWRMADLN